MIADQFEFDNMDEQREIEGMLFEMSTDDFFENEIATQLNEEIFSESKRNYVEMYIEKFKYLKDVYGDDSELVEDLKENKGRFIENIVDNICEKFGITIDENEINNKMAKSLYNFFVVYYNDNLKNFFINYMQKNKKMILAEIKKQKSKVRDVTTLASKVKYNNSNDAAIINNIQYILFNIIPSMELGGEFIKFVIDYDDTTTNIYIQKMLEKGIMEVDNDTFEAFLKPFLDMEDGYSNIISEIIITTSANIQKNDINILK